MVIEFDLPAEEAVDAFVYNVAGRRVATLRSDATVGTSARRIVWDGRTPSGAAAPSGVYFVRVASGGREWTRSYVRMGE